MRRLLLSTIANTSKVHCVVALVFLLASAPAHAATIVYDNTVPNQARGTFPSMGYEFGDEITLAGTDRTVTEFVFGYNTPSSDPFNVDGDETVRIRFYANDGASGKPGSLLYDTGAFRIYPPADINVTLSIPSVTVPDTFTWTMEFAGISQATGDQINVLRYETPAVGSSGNYWWAWTGADWSAQVTGDSNNYRARVSAVPEPTTALLLATGLGGLAAAGRRRRLQ